MNIRPDPRMDKAAFIAWMAANEGRYELAGGRVVMMPRASRAHGMLVMNVASVLRDQLDRTQWTVIAEFGLDAGPQTVRYPDIVVDRAGGGAKDYTATAPVTAQFGPGPLVIAGTEAIIGIAALQLELPLAEIYAGIETG